MKKAIIYSIITSLLISCNYFEGSKNNVKNDAYIFITNQSTFEDVLDSLQPHIIDLNSFKKFAENKGYKTAIKQGKYKLIAGETNKSLVNKLILGLQEEVKVRIKNEPTIYHMAGSVSKQLAIDSTQLVNAIIKWGKEQDSTATYETIKQFFIPNTYNFYWFTTGEQFAERMKKEYDKIWTPERKQKAKEMNLTPLEVSTLASIVQLEAYKEDEQPRVAKAYLNRLKKGMKLEADPTSIYAYKLKNGFNNKIQRVYNKHLATASAYNTYKVAGIPPAPICLPNASAIIAVLEPANHDYVYFCADPDKPGYHSYTNSFAEHERNAKKYRDWLNKNNIK